MQKSKVMIDVVGKDNTVVTAIGKVDGEGVLRVVRKVSEVQQGVPMAAAILGTVAGEIAAVKEKMPGTRICVILPEQVVIRAAEAQKLKNQGVADIGGRLLKGWMVDKSRVSDVEAASWCTATEIFGRAVRDYDGVIIWQNVRSLYRWEVKSGDPNGADLAELAGKELVFTAGANTELGLVVVDNDRYNQKATLTVTSVRNRSGVVRYRGFVPRMITVKKSDGSKGEMTAVEVSDPTLDIESGSTDGTTAVINALRLHVKAVEKLPKIRMAKKVVVVDEK